MSATTKVLLFVVLSVVALAVDARPVYSRHPQPNILTGLDYEAAGVTIYLRPEAWTDPALSAYVRATCSRFQAMARHIDLLLASQGARLVAGIGFSSHAWRQWGKSSAPPMGMMDFPGYAGPDGWPVMEPTGGDVFLHIKSSRRDAIHRLVTDFVGLLAASGQDPVERIDSIDAWRNILDGQNRDLTGYVDGTTNCPAQEAVSMGLISADVDPYHANGSFAIGQRWVHNLAAFDAMNVSSQDAVFGRTKAKSQALPYPPPDAHVVRVRQSDFGYFIVRQAMPWGDAAKGNAGLFFIAYSNDARRLGQMCLSMVGQGTHATRAGPYDAIMRFSVPATNNFWYFPSMELLDDMGRG
ncbi:Dyptype peroxidase [Mollivirus sibericum]|uniref:Dyptype peroxidase n=1 Tax=Mollivirus sibericum TaxID=1678078 RepID=UPI0006B2DAF8|nr:Dyptype peroxidase [Mollivirus sibericum]ALD62197.1 Dyptype peroxidase [Mollivirus sibericum]